MARTRLDGRGLAKMQTLEDAYSLLQRVHAIVEQMALAVRKEQNIGSLSMSLRRTASPMVDMLKAQFDTASDAVTHLVLVASRAGVGEGEDAGAASARRRSVAARAARRRREARARAARRRGRGE
jgi:hypothetical protein